MDASSNEQLPERQTQIVAELKQEISIWQKKFNELQFSVMFKGELAPSTSSDTEELRRTIETLTIKNATLEQCLQQAHNDLHEKVVLLESLQISGASVVPSDQLVERTIVAHEPLPNEQRPVSPLSSSSNVSLLQEQIKDLEKMVFTYTEEKNSLQLCIAQEQSVNKALMDQLAQLNSKNDTLTEQINTTQTTINEQERLMELSLSQIEELKSELELKSHNTNMEEHSLQKESDKQLTMKVEELTVRVTSLLEQNLQLAEAARKQEETNELLVSQQKELQEELNLQKSEYLQAKQELVHTTSELDAIQQQCDSFKALSEQLTEGAKMIAEDRTRIEYETAELKTQLADALEQYQRLTEEHFKLKESTENVISSNTKYIEELQEKAKTEEALRTENSELASAAQYLDKLREEMGKEIIDLKTQIQELSKANEALHSQKETLSNELHSSVGTQELDMLREKLVKAQRDHQQATESNVSLQTQVDELQTQVNELQSLLSSRTSKMAEASNALDDLQERETTLLAEIAQLKEQLADVIQKEQQKLEKLKEELQAKEREHTSAMEHMAENEDQLLAQLHLQKEENQDLQSRIAKVNDELRTVSQRETTLSSNLTEEANQAAELKRQIDALKKEQHETDSVVKQERKKAEKTTSELKDQLQHARENIQELGTQLDVLQSKLSEKEALIETMTKEKEQLHQERERFEQERLEFQAQVATLTKQKEELKREKDELSFVSKEIAKKKDQATVDSLNGRQLGLAKESSTTVQSAANEASVGKQKADKEQKTSPSKQNVATGMEVNSTKGNEENTKKVASKKRDLSKPVLQHTEIPTAVADTKKSPTKNSVAKDSPDKAKQKKVVVTFSGFKEGDPIYHNTYKEELSKIVIQLKGQVRNEAEFDTKITHVITPPTSRTMKTLAAALTNRWLMSPKWIVDSSQAGSFLPEEGYGNIYSCTVFVGKKICFAKSFVIENEKKPFKEGHARTLVETLGRGRIITNASEADYILIGVNDKEKHKAPAVTWNQLIDMIPGAVESDADKKSVRFHDPSNQQQQPTKKRQVEADEAQQPPDKANNTHQNQQQQQSKKSKKDPSSSSTTSTGTTSPPPPPPVSPTTTTTTTVFQPKLKRKSTD